MAGDTSRVIAADLSDAESARSAIHSAIERLDGLDHLVGAAANVATIHRAHSFPATAFRDDVATNLLSQFWTVQAAYHALASSDTASVVMFSSIGALDGLPGQASYAASKAGILGLVRTLAAEWAEAGIRVNAVVPGLVATSKVLAMPDSIRRRFWRTWRWAGWFRSARSSPPPPFSYRRPPQRSRARAFASTLVRR